VGREATVAVVGHYYGTVALLWNRGDFFGRGGGGCGGLREGFFSGGVV
jgi:hypothetical protein